VASSANLDDIKASAGGWTRSVSAENIASEGSRVVFAYFLTVPKGQTVSLEYDYSGPFAALGGQCSLGSEKELNALTWPISVDVRTPRQPPHHRTADLSVDRRFNAP
jgi:hypothetical protein